MSFQIWSYLARSMDQARRELPQACDRSSEMLFSPPAADPLLVARQSAPLHLEAAELKSLLPLPPMDNSSEHADYLLFGKSRFLEGRHQQRICYWRILTKGARRWLRLS